MKILIVGCGSIGQRHIRNFQSLGITDIAAVEPREDRREHIAETYGIADVHASLDDALQSPPDAAVICTPPTLHIAAALRLAKRGVHIFIEKPIAHDLEGVRSLIDECHSGNLTLQVGYVFRHHPSMQHVKQLLDEGAIGKVWSARSQNGSYLPDWHPWEDYRSFYMAKKALGGGALLDESHTIDWMRWLFGEVTSLYCLNETVSDLEIDTDDTVEMVLRFASGTVGTIHLDLLRRVARKDLEINGSEGVIEWDWDAGVVRLYRVSTGEWETTNHLEDYNLMYVREMEHFLDTIRSGKPTQVGGEEALRTMEVIASAVSSAESKREVAVQTRRDESAT